LRSNIIGRGKKPCGERNDRHHPDIASGKEKKRKEKKRNLVATNKNKMGLYQHV
jgi:hypothetical protein